MADVIEALERQHVSHAPLSHAQTIQVVKFLHGLHMDAMKQLAELRGRVDDNTSGIGGLRDGLALANTNIQGLQHGLSDTSTLLEKVKTQVQLNTELGARLQDTADQAAQDIHDLRSGLKVTNTNAQTLREDHTDLADKVGKTRKEIDRGIKVDLKTLNDQMGMAVHRLDNLTQASDQHKLALMDHKNGLHRLDDGAAVAAERTSRLEDVAAQLHQDLATLSSRGDTVKNNLEMTNSVVMKIHDEFEAERAARVALKHDHLALGARHDAHKQDFHKAQKEAAKLAEGHEKLLAAHATTKTDLGQTMKNVGALQEGSAQTSAFLKALSGQVDRLSVQLATTQENLQVTNALVLPNVTKGDQVSPQFGGNIGVGGGSAAVQLSPKSSVRKKREATWVMRNIGVVPNRMAWM